MWQEGAGVRARLHYAHLGAEKFHAKDIERLTRDIFFTHEDLAFQAKSRRHGCRRHAMLSRAGLGNDSLLAHPKRQKNLANGVVDLVRSGVAEIFAFKIYFSAAERPGEPLSEIKRSWPSHIFPQIVLELPSEG